MAPDGIGYLSRANVEAEMAMAEVIDAVEKRS
jgi:hypothetical protein